TENTGWLDEKMVIAAASSIPGLRVPRLLADAKSSQVSETEKALDAEAKDAAINSTPTILVGKTGSNPVQVQLSSPTDYESVSAPIERAPAGSSRIGGFAGTGASIAPRSPWVVSTGRSRDSARSISRPVPSRWETMPWGE